MENYLKDPAYYNDLYDLFTIKNCIRRIESWRKEYKERDKNPELKKFSKKGKEKALSSLLDLDLYYEKGKRYRDKKEIIQKWIEKDRIRQDKYDNTPEPQEITCPSCEREMPAPSRP